MEQSSVTSSLQLINGINQIINHGNALRITFTRYAVSVLLSQPVFAAAAGSLQDRSHQLKDACEVLLDGVAKRATQGAVSILTSAASNHCMTRW